MSFYRMGGFTLATYIRKILIKTMCNFSRLAALDFSFFAAARNFADAKITSD